MKRTILVLMLLAAAMTAGFAKGKAKKTMIEQGLSLAALMKEKASSRTYISMFASSEELLNKIREISAGDVSKPTAVYKISGNASALVQNSLGIFKLENEDLSPRVREEFERKFLFMIPMIWNNKTIGMTEMAAANIIASTTAFDSSELKENCLYIFTFADAFPVAVGFDKREDRAVIASSTFILDKDFVPSFEKMISELNGYLELKLEKIR